MRDDISARSTAIEECYEFLLAYAGQGVPGDEDSPSSVQVREYLSRAAKALSGLAEAYAAAVQEEKLQAAERYHAFLRVLDTDARDSLTAIELVLAQSAVSSQLVDNLNASIHLRALLTDLFLIDQIFASKRVPEKPPA